MSLDPVSASLILELAKLGIAAVRRVRESQGQDPDAPMTAEEIAKIRIRHADDLIELGRQQAREEP